ncbi:putative DsbA family dithiol-disulfide isomerase [Novosphingobium kunmingense]|uniref:Putative DsbA family dithiol-disulfide isomerase n=1 Tax=Novosphingobium kunmingense TaxID=1211806 RepID=A0A2N0I434_9SPHN|nr:DsbA family oxidoreductase [Novosphingobium kunmingense]PKB25933.1 putative DsbA family dithiol-disulfide isomerase [Novosphingobium kunmingense]
MTQPARLTIDIYSDVMCPWCIIGYSQLQRALGGMADEVEAEVRWLPFELNPDMPAEGEGQAEHIARKYGRTPQQAAEGRGQMKAIAERAGYSLDYAGAGDPPQALMWNTYAAHKLLKWALIEAGAEAQTRLKLALFDAHFQQRRNVSDPAVLVDIAQGVGLDPDGARAALEDEALGRIVRAEEAQAWDHNISGVPAMIVAGKYLIPGAQEPEVYANALRRIIAKEAARAEA